MMILYEIFIIRFSVLQSTCILYKYMYLRNVKPKCALNDHGESPIIYYVIMTNSVYLDIKVVWVIYFFYFLEVLLIFQIGQSLPIET